MHHPTTLAHMLVFWPLMSLKGYVQSLNKWYSELRKYRENIPVIVVANKIDVDYKVTEEFRVSQEGLAAVNMSRPRTGPTWCTYFKAPSALAGNTRMVAKKILWRVHGFAWGRLWRGLVDQGYICLCYGCIVEYKNMHIYIIMPFFPDRIITIKLIYDDDDIINNNIIKNINNNNNEIQSIYY